MKQTKDMKRILGLASLLMLFAACEQFGIDTKETIMPSSVRDDVKVYASIEQPASPQTKVYADADLKVLWNANDTISFFNKLTLNEKWKFIGEEGDNVGQFEQIGTVVGTGNDLDYYCAVYPYRSATRISSDNLLTVTLPATQTYAENSFGRGMNTMVAVSPTSVFTFKNVCGYLSFKLYGEGVSVSSITLKGNNNEPLAGNGTIPMAIDSLPKITMSDVATKKITLVCDPPVALGSSADDFTEFWMVVPPTVFESGFTITIKDVDGMSVRKKLNSSLEIERSMIRRMAPFEVAMPEPEAIDLGLSVKWASFNIGAPAPDDYGDHFAWGETSPYYYSSDPLIWKPGKDAGYDWASYGWCNGSAQTLIKYNTNSSFGTVDNKTVLHPDDDAAHINWGKSWRMPTLTEIQELLNDCTIEWTTENGVNGCRVTGKKDGYRDNSIFFPAAGRHALHLNFAESEGCYWSSSIRPDSPDCAYGLGFSPDSTYWLDFNRYRGFSIRPVYGEYVEAESLSLSNTSLTLIVGDTSRLTASLEPANCYEKNVVWSSSNTSVATVSPSGLVTAVSQGTATITAKWAGNESVAATCSITVKPAYEDLSKSGTANCYIVSKAGYYKFKTVKGNSSTSVGTVASVSVLWESFGTSVKPAVGDLVSGVKYESGYIVFTASSNKGNAVIAAKNSSGTILWSWHIWMTDAPKDQVYRNSAGKMMDRNLGAITASRGNLKSLGLLYQWGRKDPFLGSCKITSFVKAASTKTWPAVVSSTSSTGTVAYSIAHPMTFISYNTNNHDWYYSSTASTDNTRWKSSKGLYDPCPVGYRIPSGGSSGVWAKAIGNGSGHESGPWDTTNKGMNYSTASSSSYAFGTDSVIWYPATGYVENSGSYSSTGKSAYYWSCTPTDKFVYALYFQEAYFWPTCKLHRATGGSVRCQKM